MNNYKYLFVDIDNTILDFDKAEDNAIKDTLSHFNLPLDNIIVSKFKEINLSLWKEYEKGLITKSKLLEKRFEKLLILFSDFDQEKCSLLSKDINVYYLNSLKNTSDKIDGADLVLEKLSKKYLICPCTNGVYDTQIKRLEKADVLKYFHRLYVSEKVGYQKPYKEFFDYVFNDLNIKDKKEVIFLGDSLTADIKGGVEYGIDTIWFNLKNETNTITSPKYIVHKLEEVLEIL